MSKTVTVSVFATSLYTFHTTHTTVSFSPYCSNTFTIDDLLCVPRARRIQNWSPIDFVFAWEMLLPYPSTRLLVLTLSTATECKKCQYMCLQNAWYFSPILTNTWMCRCMLVKIQITEFHENPSGESKVVQCLETVRRADMVGLTVAFQIVLRTHLTK